MGISTHLVASGCLFRAGGGGEGFQVIEPCRPPRAFASSPQPRPVTGWVPTRTKLPQLVACPAQQRALAAQPGMSSVPDFEKPVIVLPISLLPRGTAGSYYSLTLSRLNPWAALDRFATGRRK